MRRTTNDDQFRQEHPDLAALFDNDNNGAFENVLVIGCIVVVSRDVAKPLQQLQASCRLVGQYCRHVALCQ